MDYREVGIMAGLKGNRLDLYVKYMTTRWKDTEKQKCLDGYAKEWAIRFFNGAEYECSDSIGQAILDDDK